jgi:AcrR family transcriptional regulator
MLFSTRELDSVPAWQQRALQRSLADARARSVERLSSFVDAARELATETGDASFTVHQVVQRAGLSLKSFYRHFAGKDALLLALIEEDTRIGAQVLGEWVAASDDPVERLRAYVSELLGFLALGESSYVAMLLREQRRLEQVDPAAMEAALAPFTDLLADLLADAGAAGRVRSGDWQRDARTVFDLALLQLHQLGPGADRAAADAAAAYLWSFCWSGLSAAPGGPDIDLVTDAPTVTGGQRP